MIDMTNKIGSKLLLSAVRSNWRNESCPAAAGLRQCSEVAGDHEQSGGERFHRRDASRLGKCVGIGQHRDARQLLGQLALRNRTTVGDAGRFLALRVQRPVGVLRYGLTVDLHAREHVETTAWMSPVNRRKTGNQQIEATKRRAGVR